MGRIHSIKLSQIAFQQNPYRNSCPRQRDQNHLRPLLPHQLLRQHADGIRHRLCIGLQCSLIGCQIRRSRRIFQGQHLAVMPARLNLPLPLSSRQGLYQTGDILQQQHNVLFPITAPHKRLHSTIWILSFPVCCKAAVKSASPAALLVSASVNSSTLSYRVRL